MVNDGYTSAIVVATQIKHFNTNILNVTLPF